MICNTQQPSLMSTLLEELSHASDAMTSYYSTRANIHGTPAPSSSKSKQDTNPPTKKAQSNSAKHLTGSTHSKTEPSYLTFKGDIK